jgi:hypothetical protein
MEECGRSSQLVQCGADVLIAMGPVRRAVSQGSLLQRRCLYLVCAWQLPLSGTHAVGFSV